jgi:N-ethylmaleimide reductase
MVMAPMTRSRALSDGVPNPLARIYHAQRAAAGLIVSEATHASAQDGYFQTPGIYAAHRVAAWAKVVEAVHAAGGKIFVQLWHTGRTSHPDPCGGRLPPAPSPIPAAGDVRVSADLRKSRVVPRALEIEEIACIVANPDLPRRYAGRVALNTPDRSTFYTGEADGHIDYPSLRE